MNTILSRLNAVFAFSLTVLAVLTLLCFLSTAFKVRDATVVVGAHPALIKRAKDFSSEWKDLGLMRFNLSVNFSSVFDWNTKQLFVLLVAHYHTERHAVNQVVLWDKIIQRGDSPVVDLYNSDTKYRFFDEGTGLKGNKNVSLQLLWNVVPHAGQLPLIPSNFHSIEFPDSYS